MAAAVDLDHEDHHPWPSLPRIRTSSSFNNRVSCETLHKHANHDGHQASAPSCWQHSSSCPHTSHLLSRQNHSLSGSLPSPPDSYSAHASPRPATSSYPFLHPKQSKTPNSSKDQNRIHGRTGLDRVLGTLIRLAPARMHQYSSSLSKSPYAGVSSTGPPASRHQLYSSAPSKLPYASMSVGTASPPAASRMVQKSAAGSHNCGALVRGNKGHLAVNSFTMMPSGIVGKKKPPDCEVEEPTSPEVTCIGKVRRRSGGKAVWEALFINEKIKKGNAKKMIAGGMQQSAPRRMGDGPWFGGKTWHDQHFHGTNFDREDIQKTVDSLHLDHPIYQGNSGKETADPNSSSHLNDLRKAMETLHLDSMPDLMPKRSVVLEWDVQNLIAAKKHSALQGAANQKDGDNDASPASEVLQSSLTNEHCRGSGVVEASPSSPSPALKRSVPTQLENDCDSVESCDTSCGDSSTPLPSFDEKPGPN